MAGHRLRSRRRLHGLGDLSVRGRPPPSCKAGASQLPRDGKYCRDNTFGRLEYSAALVPELSPRSTACPTTRSTARSASALHVPHPDHRLQRRAERRSHPHRSLSVSRAREAAARGTARDPTWATQPCFTPDMPWTVLEDTLVEKSRGWPRISPSSKIFDDNAYVRDGYIVMQFPDDTLFWFPGYKAPRRRVPDPGPEGHRRRKAVEGRRQRVEHHGRHDRGPFAQARHHQRLSSDRLLRHERQGKLRI